MMQSRTTPVFNLLPCLLAALLILLLTPTQAQSVYRPETRARLNTVIHLPLGATTLEVVTQALSAQTRLDIQPAEYLKERQLTVQMDGVNAEAALDSLAELNGWIWREAGVNHIRIEHARFPPPKDVKGIVQAIRAVLPPDIAHYLGAGWNAQTLLGVAPPAQQKHLEAITNSPFPVDDHVLQEQALRMRVAVMPARIRADFKQQQQQLGELLKPTLLDGKARSYATLTVSQQQIFANILMLQALFEWSGNIGVLLDGELMPSLTDFTKAKFVMANGNELQVVSEIKYPGYREVKFIGGTVSGLKPANETGR